MALNTVPSKNAGDVFTAAMWNTYIAGNLNDITAFCNGSLAFPGSAQYFANDGYFGLGKSGANPIIAFDPNDYLFYDRTGNAYNFVISGSVKLAVQPSGKLVGPSFYDSGEVVVTNGSTVNFAHGFGAIPRFFQLMWNNSAGSAKIYPGVNSQLLGASSDIRIAAVDSTNIGVINASGATRYVQVFAML